MGDIKQTYVIAATPEEVWAALTEPEIIREWSGADAVFPLEPGAVYSLWDGSIGGEIVEIVPMQRLVQTWKPQDWVRQDSVVTFTLVPHPGGTQVDLFHQNVEEADFDGTDDGWDTYYLGAIGRMFNERKPAAKPAAVKKPAAKAAVKKKTTVKAAPKKKKPAVKKPAAKKRTVRRGR
jgi:uncharacterized protein YndB with AHSA1/START domain